MSSELESLKQRITELEAKNDKLEAENAELRKENTEIRDLRFKLSVSDAEIAELKRGNAEVLRANGEHNERRDAENTELKSRVGELEARLAILEQSPPIVDGQPQNDNTHNENTPDNNSSNFNLGADHHEKSLEDKEMDTFLVDVNKKSIGEDIRRHNREKKLRRESAIQDVVSDTAYASETVNNVEVSDGPGGRIIDGSNNSTSSDLSRETVVIADISYTAPLDQDQDQDHDQKDIAPSVVDPNLSRDIKPLNNVKRFSENSKLSHERQKQEEEIANTPPNTLPTKNGGNVQASSSIVAEFVQDLLEELLSSDDPLQTIKFSSPKTIVPGSIGIKKLANSFCQANVARNKTIVAKRSEITLWCLFSERFEDKVVELRSNDKKLTDQTARKQIYNEMKPYLADVSIGYLQVMTGVYGSTGHL